MGLSSGWTPAASLRELPCTEFEGSGRGALLSPCFCSYFTFLTKKDLRQGSHLFSYKQCNMSRGSGTKLVNYFLVIEILLWKLRFGPKTITTLICQGLLTCWRNGMECGLRGMQELGTLLLKGFLMRSSGFTKPWLRLSLFFYFRNPDGDKKPWCFFKVNNAKVKWEYCDVPACSELGKTVAVWRPG